MSPLSTPSPSTEKDLKNIVLEGALGSVMTTVTTGAYLTGFALALGATDAMIGEIAALPSLANVLQLVGSYFLARSGSARGLCLASLMAHRLSWFGHRRHPPDRRSLASRRGVPPVGHSCGQRLRILYQRCVLA
ncbi:MAG: hypothetical protein R6U92_06320 [Bacillota bacterium]